METICVYGDSITKGVIFDAVRKRYTLLKTSFVNLICENEKISITNHSRFGCTVSQGKEIFEKSKANPQDYDFTVLEFGGNDCDYQWAEVSENPDFPHTCNTPPEKFESDYLSFIDEIKAKGGRPVLMTLPPIDAKKYFSWITNGLSAKNVLTFLGSVNKIYSWHEKYNSMVCRMSGLANVPLLDIHTEFLRQDDFCDFLCIDGIHPNEAGHQLIADTLHCIINSLKQ